MIDYPLLQGQEPDEKMQLIFTLTKLSENMKLALFKYYCEGYPKSIAATYACVLLPNLEKQIIRCNEISNTANLIAKA
jgi:hypothetical protein